MGNKQLPFDENIPRCSVFLLSRDEHLSFLYLRQNLVFSVVSQVHSGFGSRFPWFRNLREALWQLWSAKQGIFRLVMKFGKFVRHITFPCLSSLSEMEIMEIKMQHGLQKELQHVRGNFSFWKCTEKSVCDILVEKLYPPKLKSAADLCAASESWTFKNWHVFSSDDQFSLSTIIIEASSSLKSLLKDLNYIWNWYGAKLKNYLKYFQFPLSVKFKKKKYTNDFSCWKMLCEHSLETGDTQFYSLQKGLIVFHSFLTSLILELRIILPSGWKWNARWLLP